MCDNYLAKKYNNKNMPDNYQVLRV